MSHGLAGKAKSTKHMRGAGLRGSGNPIVSMDCVFIGNESNDDADGVKAKMKYKLRVRSSRLRTMMFRKQRFWS